MCQIFARRRFAFELASRLRVSRFGRLPADFFKEYDLTVPIPRVRLKSLYFLPDGMVELPTRFPYA